MPWNFNVFHCLLIKNNFAHCTGLMQVYIIAEAERKWIPTIKDVVTNRITLKSGTLYCLATLQHRLKASGYKRKTNWLKYN